MCSLPMSYGNLFAMLLLRAALDAFIAPFPLLTTFVRQGQALGATLRAAVAVQIVCPDNLSLNRSPCYAFGRMPSLTHKIQRKHRINW